MKILNFGSCNIDFVYKLDHIVAPGETETSDSLDLFPGGKGLNQSIAVARAGIKVYHAGCLGEDGQMLMDILNENGVDTSFIKIADCKNGHAIIQVNSSGENSIFLYPGSNVMITTDFVDEVLSNFDEGDYILLQNEISNIGYMIDKAHEKGMNIVLNPSPFNEIIGKIDLSKLTYLVLNEVEAKQFSHADNFEKTLEFFKTNYPELKIMLTLGSRGCVYMDKDHKIYQPIFEVEAVDTTAAGDTFTGYFIAGVARGEKYVHILRTASCASAISVSRNGAAPSIPTYHEVMEGLTVLKMKSTSKSELVREKINGYLANSTGKASLETLASELGYSSVYTGNLVKKLYGKPFSKVLQEKRCQIAANMLKDTSMPIVDVINASGYENESFFRKIFKEKYGCNMLEYRNKFGGKGND